jgi:hypothetical protein
LTDIPRPNHSHQAAHLASPQAGDTKTRVTPHHRSVLAVDIEGSTTRTNVQRAEFRDVMYELVEEAMDTAGIGAACRDDWMDRGDGLLALIHPVDQAPKTLLLATVVPTLAMLLARHNSRCPARTLRMRVVVHAGEVHYDGRGCFGEAVDLTCRLLDSPDLKKRLGRTDAPLILVVSEDIYFSVVRHGYDGIDQDGFEQLVHVHMAGRRHHGWVTIPETAVVPRQRVSPVTDLDSRRGSV